METIQEGKGRRKRRRPEEWVWVFQEHLGVMAEDRRVKWTHWRVLAYLMSRATFAQDVVVRQADIGRALGVSPESICRLLRDLDAMGIVYRVNTGQKPGTYRLNSAYVYKGHGALLEQRRAYQGKEARRG